MVFLNDSEISPADVLKPTVFLIVCKCNIWFTPFLSSLSNLVESSNFRSSSSSYKDILRFIKTRYISLNLGRLNYNKCYKQNPKVCIKLLRLSILENDFNELINVARGSCYKSARQKSSKWVENIEWRNHFPPASFTSTWRHMWTDQRKWEKSRKETTKSLS
jgi:hypothetical protein